MLIPKCDSWAGAFRIQSIHTKHNKTTNKTPSSVKTYNVTTGHLTLEHHYPRQTGRDNCAIEVNINPLLESITAEELRVGVWVNVLGYVRRRIDRKEEDYVEPVMVFPAGAVALGEYERIVRDAQDVDLARGM